jgi:hypothetical protein
MNVDASRCGKESVTVESGDIFAEGLVAGVSNQPVDVSLGDVSFVDGVEGVALMY